MQCMGNFNHDIKSNDIIIAVKNTFFGFNWYKRGIFLVESFQNENVISVDGSDDNLPYHMQYMLATHLLKQSRLIDCLLD